MVDVGTQTVSNTEINAQDLSSSKNNVFFATFMNKTQIKHVDLHSKYRDIIDFDPAIVSIGRSDDTQRLQRTCNRCHSSDKQYDDISYASNYQYQTHSDDQQQIINIVDQMIDQPHIPYALLPKHFKSKRFSNDQNQQQANLLDNNNNGTRRSHRQNYFKDNKQWYEPVIHRHFVLTNYYYESHINDCYNSYPHRLVRNRSHISSNIVPSYDFNEWQSPYRQSQQSFYSLQQRDRFR